MKTGFARVTENTRLYGDTYIMWLDSPELIQGATPGQFLMLRCADLLPGLDGAAELTGASIADDPLLGRAMSYHRIREGENGREFSILYDVVGRGTAWLARRDPGDRVYAWGPLGRGYSLPGQSGQNMLLVGGGIGIAPLLWLADEGVARGKSVVLIDGARDAKGVFPAELVPAEAEVVVTTQDGSVGRQGLVTDVFLDYYGWADQVFACGPNPMFAALSEVLTRHEGSQRARRRKPVQALLESAMGCGTGICYGCAIFDRRGNPRLVCKEGPRFELREIW
ncbi:MAG: dihydroorotate dehydrogenase electron transfer subunit [Dehalococcoidia bacterium]|nr:dihydroorotate dehydrogenase electron transfer subunit [Dehalococcoidia bacterium]